MSCTCGSDEKSARKLQILQKKYDELRRNHRKLVGVTVELTEALEGFVKGEGRPDVNNALSKCSKIYPNLFERKPAQNLPEPESTSKTTDPETQPTETTQSDITPVEKVENSEPEEKPSEPLPESEKEYYEGFWSRPRIPRTPQ